jgi:hypothetical protein
VSTPADDGTRAARADSQTLRCICGAPAPDYADPDDARGGRFDHDGPCPYVSCDDDDCRALDDPQTLEEWRAAAEHWREHSLYHGCSHGC